MTSGYTVNDVKLEIISNIPTQLTGAILAHCEYIYSTKNKLLQIPINSDFDRKVITIIYKLKQIRDPKLFQDLINVCNAEIKYLQLEKSVEIFVDKIIEIRGKTYYEQIKVISNFIRAQNIYDGCIDEKTLELIKTKCDGLISAIINDIILEKTEQTKIVNIIMKQNM